MPTDEPSIFSRLAASVDLSMDRRRPDGSRTRIRAKGKLVIAVAAAAAVAVPLVGGMLGSSSDTDPRFATCQEAKAAGYGNYREGEDSEFAWYRDANRDGVVCQ